MIWAKSPFPMASNLENICNSIFNCSTRAAKWVLNIITKESCMEPLNLLARLFYFKKSL